ncbi:hypothetical protein MMC25_007368 [Agyrium rufum]|nr:hypothetical protein [Agyrium rufum]
MYNRPRLAPQPVVLRDGDNLKPDATVQDSAEPTSQFDSDDSDSAYEYTDSGTDSSSGATLGTAKVVKLKEPDRQKPSVLFTIGRRAKQQALRAIFPKNNLAKGTNHGVASLRADNDTLSSKHPLLFADSDPSSIQLPPNSTLSCHEPRKTTLDWSIPFGRNLINIFYARLFYLFADVICIFAQDLNGLEGVQARLLEWAAIGVASDLSRAVRPRVIVITQGADPSPSLIESSTATIALKAAFSSLTIIRFADEQITPTSRYRPLKDTIKVRLIEARSEKERLRCFFSFNYLTYLFI